jgi:hypothetical protein
MSSKSYETRCQGNIYVYYIMLHYIILYWPLLKSSGQSSCLQIQRSWFDSRALPDFLRNSGFGTGSTQPREYNWGASWKKKSSGSGLESRDYGLRDASRWPRGTLYPQRLTVTSPTSGGRSVGVVCSRTQAREFFFYIILILCYVILYYIIHNSPLRSTIKNVSLYLLSVN